MQSSQTSGRPRDLGIEFGVFPTGRFNAITDVDGVLVGQVTLEDDAAGMHTGVTAIRPHPGNVFEEKVPAGIFLGNAFGKMAVAGCGSYSKVEGFGFLPINCFVMALTTFISQNLGANQ